MTAENADDVPRTHLDTYALADVLAATDAVKTGDFELSHGGTSDYYIDAYQWATDDHCLLRIASAFAHNLPADAPETVTLAGVALGGVPFVSATSILAECPSVLVRKAAKDHGTGNQLEGQVAADRRVIVLEDVTTTGQSAADAVKVLRDAGATVDEVWTVVDREAGAAATLAEYDVEFKALVTASEVVAAADETADDA